MNLNKHLHPAVSYSVLTVFFLSSVTMAGVFYLTHKAELARDHLFAPQHLDCNNTLIMKDQKGIGAQTRSTESPFCFRE